MDYSLKEVAGRIKALREASGYSQEELARLTGVSPEDYAGRNNDKHTAKRNAVPAQSRAGTALCSPWSACAEVCIPCYAADDYYRKPAQNTQTPPRADYGKDAEQPAATQQYSCNVYGTQRITKQPENQHRQQKTAYCFGAGQDTKNKIYRCRQEEISGKKNLSR